MEAACPILAAAGEKSDSQGNGLKTATKQAQGNMPGSESTTGTGTGLVNVASRLRLYFRRADVFDIQTNDEGGTSFILKIPRLGKKDL